MCDQVMTHTVDAEARKKLIDRLIVKNRATHAGSSSVADRYNQENAKGIDMPQLADMTIAPHQTKLTLEEFLQQPETKPASEYIEGEIIQKPMPKGRHSRLQGKLCDAVNRVCESDRVAYAFPELRCSFGAGAIVADIAVFLWAQIPFTETGEVPDRFNLPPDWIVEVLSPEQKPNKVIGNILYCLNFGSRLGWFLDPDDGSILVFVPEQQPRLYLGNEVLPVLEGIPLRLTVEQVYGWLKMQ